MLIQPREGEKGWQRYDAYLFSEKKYKDFVADFEYSYPPGGNSGFYFRIGDLSDPVKNGIEAQILDSSKKKEPLTAHDHGGICLLYTSPSPRDQRGSRMPSSA